MSERQPNRDDAPRSTRRCCWLLWPALLCLIVVMVQPAHAQGDPEAVNRSCDYISWSGHRFAGDAAGDERDIRWYADLGFTHSYMGNAGVNPPENLERAKRRLELFAAYGMTAGLRFHFPSDGAELAEQMGLSHADAVSRGIILMREQPSGMSTSVNPCHPDVIDFISTRWAATIAAYRSVDSHGVLRLFLIGTEQGWPLPKTAEQAHPAALAHIVAAARADGALAADADYDSAALRGWWDLPYERGGDWRLRQAIEAKIREVVPDAQFTTDPIWAVKILSGYGQDWSYIGNDPKNIANASVRILARSRPAPASQLVQLIRTVYGGSFIPPDVLQESNLLPLCMGTAKIGHWGIQFTEPGRADNLFYGEKGGKPSPAGFPYFDGAGHITDWPALKRALGQGCTGKGSADVQAVCRLFDADLRAALREASVQAEMTDAMELDGLDAAPTTDLEPNVRRQLNAILASPDMCRDPALQKSQVPKRVTELMGRTDLQPIELAELNRLMIEAVFPDSMASTNTPTVVERRLDYRRLRRVQEPIIRSTGRFVRHYGPMLEQWAPRQPRLAVIGGVYGHTDLNLMLITGAIPFDILYNEVDRRASLKTYTHVLVAGSLRAEDYADLLAIEAAGGNVLLPADFETPAGQPALERATTWQLPEPPETNGGKGKGKGKRRNDSLPDEPIALNDYLRFGATSLRKQLHSTGFRPYADTDNLALVMQTYTYNSLPVIFLVNDRREFAGEAYRKVLDRGLANEIDLTIHDDREGLRAMDLDTGATLELTRGDDGWHLVDTVEPAAYRLYAILGPDDNWAGPGPLPPADALLDLTATAAADGVTLSWRPDVADWVGCELQSVRILRASDGQALSLLDEIYAHDIDGPGGLVTSYTDRTAKPGTTYTYAVQGVSPLRRLGPVSRPTTH